MAKLHEVLAVEGDLKGTADKIITETRATFDKKPDHFQEQTAETKYFDDSQQNLNTSETKALVTTVGAKLKYMTGAVGRYFDAFLSKELTNQVAHADVVVNGVVIFGNVPATALLGMESRLKELRAVYEAIPTLAPGKVWEPDAVRQGVYLNKHPEERSVTRRTLTPFELSPATKEHPAQVKALEVDVPVAKKVVQEASGMLSAGEKSDLLERLDALIRAVKKARQKANGADQINGDGFGAALFGYLHAGLK